MVLVATFFANCCCRSVRYLRLQLRFTFCLRNIFHCEVRACSPQHNLSDILHVVCRQNRCRGGTLAPAKKRILLETENLCTSTLNVTWEFRETENTFYRLQTVLFFIATGKDLWQGFPNWGTCTPGGTFAYLKGYI